PLHEWPGWFRGELRPHVGVAIQVRHRREDANNRLRISSQVNHAPDDVWVAAELLLPESPGHHHGGIRVVVGVLFGSVKPSQNGTKPERVKKVLRGRGGDHHSRRTVSGPRKR